MYNDLKILIADDHALFRKGLIHLIEVMDQDVTVLEANSIEEISEILTGTPDMDLILLDLMMPGVQGLGGLEQLRNTWPEIPVIVISAREDVQTIRDALARGAMGFIPKSSAANVTAAAIRLVLSGAVYVPPTLLTEESTQAAPPPAAARPSFADFGLTARQVEIMQLISRGKSNSEIASVLDLTVGTVKMHVYRIFKVLEVANRTSAAARFSEIERELTQGA